MLYYEWHTSPASVPGLLEKCISKLFIQFKNKRKKRIRIKESKAYVLDDPVVNTVGVNTPSNVLHCKTKSK